MSSLLSRYLSKGVSSVILPSDAQATSNLILICLSDNLGLPKLNGNDHFSTLPLFVKQIQSQAKESLATCQQLIVWLKNLICQLLFDCISFFGSYELMKYNKALYCLNSSEYIASDHITPFVLVCACQRGILWCLCFPLELSPLIWSVLDDMVIKNTTYLVEQNRMEALLESKEGNFPETKILRANIYWVIPTCQTLL